MKLAGSHKAASVALLQLGPEVHAALESAAQRSGQSKSEFVRNAIQGAIQAEEGYWERLLTDVLRTIPELIEAAADAGLLTKEEAWSITNPMDQTRQRMYGVLDRIDELPIHWTPKQGEEARPYQEVMRIRASRDQLLRPETEPMQHLRDRFVELANTLYRREKEKAKAGKRNRRRR